jgi:hypothetical protein
MAGVGVNFGGVTLEGAMATFGGQTNPICNYTSPLAKKFIYKEKNKIFYPLRRHIFRMKVKTAAEIRFHEVIRKFMAKKLTNQFGAFAATATNNFDFDHSGYIIPKDFYEVKKLTSYMTSKKMSDEYKAAMQDIWTKVLFVAESNNYVGRIENISHQYSRPATDEEFMAWMWYVLGATIVTAAVVTAIYWWWKYGQQPQYVELK